MSKTQIKWTNHKDRKQVGKTETVNSSRAKQLIRDGLAVAVDSPKARKSEPAKADEAKGK